MPKDYQRAVVKCVTGEGTPVEALIYEEKPFEFGDAADNDYLKYIITGAREHHLPEDWIRYLESFLPPVR